MTDHIIVCEPMHSPESLHIDISCSGYVGILSQPCIQTLIVQEEEEDVVMTEEGTGSAEKETSHWHADEDASARPAQRCEGTGDEVCSPKMQWWSLLALADLFVINRPHTRQ